MIVRGCGRRQQNAIYAMVQTSPEGMPLERFLFCPPKPLPQNLRLSFQGQKLIEDKMGRRGMLDWIGIASYPNVVDFLREGELFGFSFHIQRSVARQLRFGDIALPVHGRAIVLNWQDIAPRWLKTCPNSKHPIPGEVVAETDRVQGWFASTYPDFDAATFPYGYEMCSGYWWSAIEGGIPLDDDTDPDHLLVRREMPSFSYLGCPVPASVKLAYQPGIIAGLPLSHLEIVRGDKSDEIAEELERIGAIDIRIEEEE